MFQCGQIILTQFRNYDCTSFQFNKKIIAICGSNGSGKTNLLDSIYYLCFTKSSFNRPDGLNVKEGFAGFRLEGKFFKNDEETDIVCILRENNKKEFLINNKIVPKLSDHIGNFPCVIIAPDDVSLITEGSEERRKFIDNLLCQLQHDYLENLISYNKILQQRNSFLKFAAERNEIDESLLDVLNNQLIEKGNFIFERRKLFLEKFLPQVLQQYHSIAENKDELLLQYNSQLVKNDFKELLQYNLSRDLFLQRTGAGIHKDEIEITLNKIAFKIQASQGQRKSLLFALKLAAFETLKKNKGFPPVLLLDDVFEKLDEHRMQNLLQYVCVLSDAQVFITDTHKERLQNAFRKINTDYDLIEL